MDNKITNEVLINTVLKQSSVRRLSKLNGGKLKQVWSVVSQFVCEQLTHHRSVQIPGIGNFHSNRNGSLGFEFVPSYTWESLRGLKSKKTSHEGVAASDVLNFYAISQNISGFSRENVESGLKDLIFSLFFLLRSGYKLVHLKFPNLGSLHVTKKNINFKFTLNQDSTVNSPTETSDTQTTTAPETKVVETKPQEEKPEEKIEPVEPPKVDNQPKPLDSEHNKPTEKLESIVKKNDKLKAIKPVTPNYELEAVLEAPNRLAPIESKELPATPSVFKSPSLPQISINNRPDTEGDPNMLFLYGLRSYKGHHTHTHSANRLWNDLKCPICRQEATKAIEVKHELRRKELEHDKLLLELSVDVDREYFNRKKSAADEIFKQARESALYNQSKAAELEQLKRDERKKKIEMGDLFESRVEPRDLKVQSRNHTKLLLEQINQIRQAKLNERNKKESDDYSENRQFLQKYNKDMTEDHYKKINQQQELRTELDEQVYIKKSQKEPSVIMTNYFARDESPITKSRRDAAKKLYQEQLDLLKQKREYEERMASMDRKAQLERLGLIKARVLMDTENARIAKLQTQKTLVDCWSNQINFRRETAHFYP